MLFSARDRGPIEKARAWLVEKGVLCEIRTFRTATPEGRRTCYPELWVQADPDYHTASILYASPLRLLREAERMRGR
jgi:hypothetical protein